MTTTECSKHSDICGTVFMRVLASVVVAEVAWPNTPLSRHKPVACALAGKERLASRVAPVGHQLYDSAGFDPPRNNFSITIWLTQDGFANLLSIMLQYHGSNNVQADTALEARFALTTPFVWGGNRAERP